MLPKKHLLLFVLIVSVLFFCGKLPVNPDNPDNSACSITLISQSSGLSDTAVSDTVNATVMAIMKYTYPEYFDSVNIKLLYPDKNLSGTMSIDTSISVASFTFSHFDSTIIYLKLKNPGINQLIVTSYISNKKSLIDSAKIIVQAKNVNSTNLPPVAKNDSYSVAADEVLNIAAAKGVLVNDTDPEGSILSAVLTDSVSAVNGSLIFNPDGSFAYTPALTAATPVTFSYSAKDANGNTSVKASVSIEIKPANRLPVISGNSPLSLFEGTDSLRHITAADPDSTIPVLSVTDTLLPNWIVISQPVSNSITLTIAPDHSVATGSRPGSFTIHFTATDNKASVNDSLVITVNNVIQKGSVDDSYVISADETLLVTAANGVLANDTNQGTGTMTAIIKDSLPSGSGTLVFNTDGSFSFSPIASVSKIVSFSYAAIYASGDTSSPAKVSITINRINKPPVISGNQAITLSEGADSTRQINATDPDGTTPKIAITDAIVPDWLTYTNPALNTLSLSIKPGYSVVTSGASAAFTVHFSLTDDSVTVKDSLQIFVRNFNQKPVITVNSPDAVDTVISGSKVTFNVGASDPDGSISKVNAYKNGILSASMTTEPYTFTTEELPYGTYSYVFAAIDNSGDTTRSSAVTIKSSNWLVDSKPITSYQATFDRNGNPVMYDYYSYNHTMRIFKFLSGTWQEAFTMTLPDADTLKFGNPGQIQVVFTQDNQPAVLLMSDDNGMPDVVYSFIVKQRNSDGTWSNVCNEIDRTLDYQSYYVPQLNVLSTGTFMLCINQGSQGNNGAGALHIQNGSSWKELNFPSDRQACQLYNDNSNFYSISGNFNHESNYKVHKFNGTTWIPIGAGDGTVTSSYNLTNMCFNSSGTPYVLSNTISNSGYSIYTLGSSSEWEKAWPFASTPDETSSLFCLGAKNDQVYSAFIHSNNNGESDTLFFKKLTDNTLSGAYSSTGFVYETQGLYSTYLSMSFKDNTLPVIMWRTSSIDNSIQNINVAYLKVP